MGLFMKTAKQGGDVLVHAAVSPDLEAKGGLYLENSQIRTPSAFCRNLENQKIMWEQSCDLCDISDFF